jgi:hypothetical protein
MTVNASARGSPQQFSRRGVADSSPTFSTQMCLSPALSVASSVGRPSVQIPAGAFYPPVAPDVTSPYSSQRPHPLAEPGPARRALPRAHTYDSLPQNLLRAGNQYFRRTLSANGDSSPRRSPQVSPAPPQHRRRLPSRRVLAYNPNNLTQNPKIVKWLAKNGVSLLGHESSSQS